MRFCPGTPSTRITENGVWLRCCGPRLLTLPLAATARSQTEAAAILGSIAMGTPVQVLGFGEFSGNLAVAEKSRSTSAWDANRLWTHSVDSYALWECGRSLLDATLICIKAVQTGPLLGSASTVLLKSRSIRV